MKNSLEKFNKKLKTDLKDLVKNHWLKLVGFIIAFILPFGHLIGMTIKLQDSERPYTLTLWCLPIFVLVVVIYFAKLRGYIKNKLQVEEQIARQDITKINTANLSFLKIFDYGCGLISIWAIFLFFKNLESIVNKVITLTLIMAICMTIGVLCFIIDSFIAIGENLPNE